VGARGQVTQGPNVPNPRTKYKRSKYIFAVTSIAVIIGRDWPQLEQPLAQSLTGSPGTLPTFSLGDPGGARPTPSAMVLGLFVCLGFEDPSNHWTKRLANGNGTGPDYLVNRDDQKNEGPFGEKNFTKIKK